MKTRVDRRFLVEAETFSLRYQCDACAAFDPERLACAYGFPTAPHRLPVAKDTEQTVFCKAFEVA